ncbi:MAG: hypothetical protein J6S58_07815 [Lentisphaeria bacterium]|nr:hypothetical protein [Lentisphaeria bacterium]
MNTKKSNFLNSGLFRFVAVLTLLGALLPLQGAYPSAQSYDFTKKDTFKNFWSRNGWKGYRPFPVFGYDAGAKAFHVSGDHKNQNGFCFNAHRRVAVKAGEVLHYKFHAWGRGRISVGVQYFSGKDWVGIGQSVTRDLPGTSEGGSFVIDIPVENLRGKVSTSAVVTFGGSVHTELFLRNFSVEVLSQESVRKKGPFLPVSWKAFGPILVKDAVLPDLTKIKSVPETLTIYGKVYKGKVVSAPGGIFDMGSYYKDLKYVYLLLGSVDSPETLNAVFGAGCDWWMTWFFNGKKVLDTRPDGNDVFPCSTTDFRFSASLKKGRNIIGLLYRRGGASAIMRYSPSAGAFTADLLAKKKADLDLEAQYIKKLRLDRPRLFLTPAIAKQLRNNPTAANREYIAMLEKYVDKLPVKPVIRKHNNSWGEVNDYGHRSSCAALLYLVTGKKKYFTKAINYLEHDTDRYLRRYAQKKAISWYSYSRIGALCTYDWLYNDMIPEQRSRLGGKLLSHVIDSMDNLKKVLKYNGEGSSGPKSGFYGTRNLWWYAGVAFYKTNLNDVKARELLKRGFADHLQMFQHRVKLAGREGGPITQSPGYTLEDYWKQEYRFYHSFLAATGENFAERMGALAALPEWIYRSSIPMTDKPGTPAVQDFGSGDCSHFNNRYAMPGSYLAQFPHFYGKRYPKYAGIARYLQYLYGDKKSNIWGQHIYRNDVYMPLLYKHEYKKVDSPELSNAKFYRGIGQTYIWGGKRSKDGTAILFTGGGSSLAHKHTDEGNFIIYKNGFQVMDTGARLIYSGMVFNKDYEINSKHMANYFLRASAHNCLLIYMPEEDFGSVNVDGKIRFARVNDGGMTAPIGGKMLVFEDQKEYTYASLDLSGVYNPKKAKSVIRSVVRCGEDLFIVYDRIHAVKADYKKTFLCHTGAEPVITGNTYQWNNMKVTALLPEKICLTKVGGPGKEYTIQGKNYPIAPADEARKKKHKYLYGEWRVESSPVREKELIHFLHVFHIGKDHCKAVLSSTEEKYIVTVPGAKGVYNVAFRKDGTPCIDFSLKNR